jgi:hypothetical protein
MAFEGSKISLSYSWCGIKDEMLGCEELVYVAFTCRPIRQGRAEA